jgi:TetR/AcrR family transcriptional regulator, cholesterol catabolism regulator
MSTSLPISRDSEAKLEHILRHAAQIFAERGFEGASIRDISRASGVSLAGLYYYFDSKQELLYLIQNATFSRVLESVRLRLNSVHEPVARLRVLVQNHVEYFLSHPHEMKVLSHEDEALEEPYYEKVAAIKRRYYALAREIFDALAADGLAPGVNPRLAVLSLFGMMNWVYKWHNAKVDPDPTELTEAIVGLFLYGVLSRPSEGKEALDLTATPVISAET